MDPVNTAKKLIDSLINEQYDEEDDKMETEQEETEQEETEEGETPAASSVKMKPASFAGKGNDEVAHDAHGGGVQDAHGGKDQIAQPATDGFVANRKSIEMKPSFATAGQTTAMSEEKVREDLQSIFGNQDLSEEFMNKAGSIYEAAVIAKANEVIHEIHEQYETAFAQEVEDVKEELTEKVDSYLNYVVDEWMTENKLAIENGIRTEIAESFITKLKDLFVESYIDVPQNKTNLFDEMAETIEELEGRVNEEINRNVSLVNENKAIRAVSIFMEQTKNLTDVQSDKVAKLAENIEFESDEDFADKIKTIVENMSKTPAINESKKQNNQSKFIKEDTTVEYEDSDSMEDTINDPRINLYSQVLSRTLQK